MLCPLIASISQDSAVSSIVFAYLLSEEAGSLHVPVMNIVAADYPLRTDVRFALDQAGITGTELVFLDQLTEPMEVQTNLQVVLVDHNKLSVSQQYLEPRVVRILDHHRDEGFCEKANPRNVVFPLGSSCTLVAQHAFDKCFTLDSSVARLLLSTILVDTGNLDPSMGKTEALDLSIARALGDIAEIQIKEEDNSSSNRSKLYAELLAAKYNVSGLTTAEHFRKDYKEFAENQNQSSVLVGMSSVLKDLAEFEMTELSSQAYSWMQARNLKVFLVLTAFFDEKSAEKKEFRRQVLLCTLSKDHEMHDSICAVLKSKNLDLKPLTTFESAQCRIQTFEQLNLKASRKQIYPIISDFFSQNKSAI